jgi:GT2 family glycosyltransferase
VPSYNHWREIETVVARLSEAGLAVFIIDDGSGQPARSVLARLHAPEGGIVVSRLDPNQGKGGAVIEGFRLAHEGGFSHAIQVDADGQHDLDALPSLLALSERHPTALVSGRPVYDTSIPLGRQIGRWLTHFWVWIETLSFKIGDSMCGFRAYPVAAVTRLLACERLGRRMDFDIEVMVRLFWRGTPVVSLPVKVIYPEANNSNFFLIRDNWQITRMHTRLVFTMLWRLPSILRNRPPQLMVSTSEGPGSCYPPK